MGLTQAGSDPDSPVSILAAMFDLVIRGALLLDGMGSAPERGSLAVSHGRIAQVGRVEGATRQTIDADGLALMPGIIDNHTHYDAQITWDPGVSPSPQLGVTTAVIGNCGFTIAPCRSRDRELVMRNLTQVEGMSLEVLRQGIRWQFETIPEYLDMLERQGAAVNVAVFAGHSALRTYVMGDAATRRAATQAEIDAMKTLLLEAMRAGAIGFSTSTSPAHNGEGGLPMPSRLADEKELRTLVASLKEAGRGVFMLTKGGHTKLAFLEELAAESTRPVVVAALLHNSTNPDSVFQDLEGIAQANARGRRMAGAVSCCPLSMDFTLRSPYTFEGLESWQPALALKGAAYEAKLREKRFRDGVRQELSRPAHFRLFNGEWDKVQVIESSRGETEQRAVAQLAREAGKDPLDFMLDLALDENLQTVFSALLLNSDEDAVGRMLCHPASLVSLSDAGAHLTFFNDAGFGLHLLGHWVRDRGVLTLAEAVRRLTSHPASVFGIGQRGALQPGYHADLLLFDPATVDRGPKQRVFDLPGGHPRLTTPAVGVKDVWVNGVRFDEQARAGHLLREFSA
jgi:N-acyl-D-aspartate/D-glutamate deacylase